MRMRRRIVIHNHLPGRDGAGGLDWNDKINGASPFPRDKSRLGGDHRDAIGVSRAKEERNRDAAYKKTGITRVHNDGGPGSGPKPGGGKGKSKGGEFPEAKGWKHLPPATQRQLEGIQKEINKLETQPWSEKLDKEHAALMKKRHELGWENPWIGGIVGGLMGKRRR